MRKDWRNCAPQKNKRGGVAKYDVLVTIVRIKTVKDEKDKTLWMNQGISFTFKNHGFDRITDHRGKYLRITRIEPNTQRIYFDFMIDDYNNRQIGRSLSKDEKDKCYRTIFPFASEIEKKIVAGHWIGEYDLQYDGEDYYIENRASKGWRL